MHVHTKEQLGTWERQQLIDRIIVIEDYLDRLRDVTIMRFDLEDELLVLDQSKEDPEGNNGQQQLH